MRLRVLDFGFQSPLMSQAVYHGIASLMRAGDEPVLTLVNPDAPYVCIGLHQDLEREVDESYCRAAGLPIIRRHVGGGAVYLDQHQMFFHFIFPRAQAPSRVAELYPWFAEPVLRTYQELGIAANLRPVNDIHVQGRKIGGMGAAAIEEATVVVGSFLFDFDVDTMAKCLRVASEKFRDKLRSGLRDYMTTMRRELAVLPERASVKARFLQHIVEALRLQAYEDVPSPAERSAIAEQAQRLDQAHWTRQPGRRRIESGIKIAEGVQLTESAFKAPGGLVRVRLLSCDRTIADLSLSGDFTCIPADGVEALAHGLRGTTLQEDRLREQVECLMSTLGLDMPGISAQDLTAAVLAAAGIS